MTLMPTDIIWLYIISLLILLILDAFWIGVLAQEFYKKEMRRLMRRKPVMPAIFTLYAITAVGYAYLAVVPALEAQQFTRALINGLVLGASMFGLYSLTAYALISGWSRRLAIVEMVWGIAASLVVSGGTYLAFELLIV